MSKTSRNELLHRLRYEYRQAGSRKQRIELLDLWCRVSGHERKYANKELLAQRGPAVADVRRKESRQARGGSRKRYGSVMSAVLRAIWEASGKMCGMRLKAALPLWLPSWERHHGVVSGEVRELLLRISRTQIDRLLAPWRQREKRRPAPGSEVKRQVPVRTGPWQAQGPGWVEVDTVAHCGGNMGGCFAWSVCMTDIWSGWTEVRASWNRSERVVHASLQLCEAALPFSLRGYDSDNGGEVLNKTVLKWLRAREPAVEITRSRPYQKNDNAHVEQKNQTHIRQLLGYGRMGEMEAMEPLNALLADWSVWKNLYQPSLKLLSRERQGGRVIKRWEPGARTPAQRVMEHCAPEHPARQRVEALLAQHDPITLGRCLAKRHQEMAQRFGPLEGADPRALPLCGGTGSPLACGSRPAGPAAQRTGRACSRPILSPRLMTKQTSTQIRSVS